MIRQLKMGEKFKQYRGNTNKIIEFTHQASGKLFVNDDNFLHNDVGPAFHYDGSLYFGWHWNGHWIE